MSEWFLLKSASRLTLSIFHGTLLVCQVTHNILMAQINVHFLLSGNIICEAAAASHPNPLSSLYQLKGQQPAFIHFTRFVGELGHQIWNTRNYYPVLQ